MSQHRTCFATIAGAVAITTFSSCDLILDIPERDAANHLICEGEACACESPWGDCNATLADGCEVDFSTSQVHCGGCRNLCSGGECEEGVCQCAAEFGDCDGEPTNGCESLLLTDPDHCGACARACLDECSEGTCRPGLIAAVNPTGALVLLPTGDLVTSTLPYHDIVVVRRDGGSHVWAQALFPLDTQATAGSVLTAADDGYLYWYWQTDSSGTPDGPGPTLALHRAPVPTGTEPVDRSTVVAILGSGLGMLRPPQQLVQRGDHLYYPDPYEQGGIIRLPAGGGAPESHLVGFGHYAAGIGLAKLGDDLFTFDSAQVYRLSASWPDAPAIPLIDASELQSIYAVGDQLAGISVDGSIRFTPVDAPVWSAPIATAWNLTTGACPPQGVAGPAALYVGFVVADLSQPCVAPAGIQAFLPTDEPRSVFDGNGISLAADADLLFMSLGDGVYRAAP